jgi:sulfate/thiosulfate transport system substrate-binding protein
MPPVPSNLLRLGAIVSAVAIGAAGCGGTSESTAGGGSGKLTLVAYSTPQEAYKEIIPAFQKTAAGKGVKFDQSYGSSGEQERSIEAGLPADVAALSLEPDIAKLVEAGVVAPDWNKDDSHGFVTKSVAVLAVRKGNPKHIRTWDDLVKPGVEVITPNPFTSGGARWNVLAAYGAQLEQGRTPEQGLDYLKRLFQNVPVQDKSAREALQTFSGGKGDVLIAYENEAITAQQKGEDLDYVIPDQTILIENPAAVIEESRNKDTAQAFLDYVRSEPAQRVFAAKGYRSIDEKLVDEKRYPDPPGLFTIERLGGWGKASDEFFDPENGSVAKILRDLGVSTASG